MLWPTSMVDRTRSRRRAGARGFTLTEMMITVAMIGVLSALGLVSYRRYINLAQAAEAKTMILAIRGGQETYKSEMLQYLNVSSSISTYYPNLSPNDTKYSWVYPPHTDYPNWMLLNLNPDGPVRFGYACASGLGGNIMAPSDFTTNAPSMPPALASGVPWYSIQAKNQRNPARPPELYGSVSVDNMIFSQNSGE
jgi:type IV pilus assembly protein PilA